MLSKNRRIPRKLIEKILKEGKTVRGRNLFLKYSLNPGKPASFAFIISSKTVKKAVLRNKLKRRGRAIIFNFLPEIKDGYSVLIFFEKGSVEMKFAELKQEIRSLFQKAGLIKGICL